VTTTTPTPSLTLNNGVAIPQLGFGVFQVPPEETRQTVSTALEVGYRHIDTAAAYRNEKAVGQAIADSGIPRDELFITTKLWNADHARAAEAFETSLERLGLDRVDLYLIHWPVPKRDGYVTAWLALQEVYATGRARAIGVSNFTQAHLERLLAETTVVPAVDQVELHPYFTQETLRGYLAEHDIHTEAWSPLGQGGDLLGDVTITELATRLGKTPAQVILRWHIQLGNIVFPKSSTPARIRSNFEIFDFELEPADVGAISALHGRRGTAEGRLGPDPEDFDVA